ncbi:MAG: DUF2330 domain-containing protein [Myxococcales bacterium]|nr:DUF2330 domain-containing protein [Myxococcales bacterium]
MKTTSVLLSCCAAVALCSDPADACGCFAPPNPTVPVVQAGERILFAVKNGEVTAHVQVQYSGASGADFGWLLPLPAVPTLELGTDEVFVRLTQATQPQYQLTTTFDSSCQSNSGTGGGSAANFGGGSAAGGSAGFADAGFAPSPLVVQDSVGPYDYAVLRSDSKAEMLAWLMANRYFVPANSDAAIDPYIRPGAYFLALKLRPGNSTGDLQPVVLRYQSDVGQIPITLTSVGATQNMGVQVWLLGAGRGIPRNYHHTVINDALIDWANRGQNYNDVIIRAVGEAPGRHSFVTEFAGPGARVGATLNPPTRFGTRQAFATAPTPEAFIDLLLTNGFTGPTLTSQQQVFSGPLKAILTRYLPLPAGVTADTFFFNYRFFKAQAPAPDFQPQAMADEIWLRVVKPIQEAAALFDEHPVLTRLYTTLSPADMNKDPVFSFSRTLPQVSNFHTANLHVSCSRTQGFVEQTRSVLTTEQGARRVFPRAQVVPPDQSVPASLRIELLREEGGPEVVVDNTDTILLTNQRDPVQLSTPSALPLPRGGCQSIPVEGVVGVLALLLARRRAR